jgi:AraC-like DNA-binding protein
MLDRTLRAPCQRPYKQRRDFQIGKASAPGHDFRRSLKRTCSSPGSTTPPPARTMAARSAPGSPATGCRARGWPRDHPPAARASAPACGRQPLTLTELAEVAGLSIWRFATVFRPHIGTSPHRYICRLRVERAQMREGVPAATAASEAGFYDQSHLSRHFKSFCGMTPGQYLTAARL